MKLEIKAGSSHPLGSSLGYNGVNFSIYSKGAMGVSLLLFRDVDSPEPYDVIRLDPALNRTNHYWHIFIEGVGPGALYGFRVEGPYLPEVGKHYDPSKVLVDPYAKELRIPANYDRDALVPYGQDTQSCCIKSVVVDMRGFDWQGTRPINRPLADTVIYEMHVGGFTRHPNSGVSKNKRGTYAGVIEKIPYLKSLGITAVELMPVLQFDPQDAPNGKPNYWGYSPIGFFAPHAEYSSDKRIGGPFREFREMVRALHKADIEVILDVVFNHTAEGGRNGPTQGFRGLQNEIYYMLERDRQWYSNYSGCGNTCNANNSIVRRMIRDALKFWVMDMHVDGFRFDLASVLARDSQGNVMNEPPLLWSIDSDPVLAGTKIIAEAWDAGGLYQVGQFVGDRWNEWNGLFRDDVRAFFRGDEGMVGAFSNRLLGSPDIYYKAHHAPQRSINFITSHDGFTMNDLVTYNEKHNFDNGERNRDGDNHNLSYNYGVEGPTDDPEINLIRERQMKNFFITLLMSLGTPMISMGDEVKRTQQGNNNAYCQNNELSWFDWSLVEKNANMLRFVRKLAQLRRYDEALEQRIHSTLNDVLMDADIEWHGLKPNEPDWAHHSHTLAMSYSKPYSKDHLYLAFNSFWEPLTFELPEMETRWFLVVDTAAEAPNDIFSFDQAPVLMSNKIELAPRSAVVLVANPLIEVIKR
jgi:glycogen operon protein